MSNIGKTVKILLSIQILLINFILSNKEEPNLIKILTKSELNENFENSEINLEPKSEEKLNDDFLELTNNLNNMKNDMIKTLQEKKQKEKLFIMNLEKKEKGIITKDSEFFQMPKMCKKYFNIKSKTNLKTVFLSFKTEFKNPKAEKNKFIFLFKNSKVQNFLKNKFRKLAQINSDVNKILEEEEKGNDESFEKKIDDFDKDIFYKFHSLPPLIEEKKDYFYEENKLFEILPIFIDYY